MKILRGVLFALFAATLCSTFSPGIRADQWDKKTTVTFNETVEVSGQVLPPGTYVFKLLNSSSDRHIVQVWDADETQIVTTVVAVPAERTKPADDSIFEFDERPVDQPVALRTWFYPGDAIGQEFTYSYHYRLTAVVIGIHLFLSLPPLGGVNSTPFSRIHGTEYALRLSSTAGGSFNAS